MPDSILVLHVDDDPDFGDLLAEFLTRENDRFSVVTEASAADGLERIEAERPDCIVSDYDMPGQNGIEFLEAVREDFPDLPFILFTGKGSEAVASDAISAGATDYLQKQPGTDQYTLLANRVQNAVTQHRSKQELARERSNMQFALTASDAAIWTRDVETDEMECHPTVCPVFGTTIDSLGTFLEQIHPEERSGVEETVRSAAREGESFSREFRFPAEGETRWGAVTGRTIVEDGDGSVQTGITRDVTEYKERERRFRTLTSNLPGMVYRCANAPEWPMQDVRGAVVAFSGYTAGELESDATKWGEEVVHPEDRERVWESVQDSLASGDSFELTYRIRTKDGETRWVWERGRGVFGPDDEVEALEGFITDITDRKALSAEFRRNERRFEALFDDPNILVAMLDTDGTVQQVNDTALEYVDTDRESVLGTEFWETPWWRPDSAEKLKAWIDRATDGEYVEYEVDHSTTDGDVFTAEGAVRPVTDDSDTVVSLIVSARDVTSRRHQGSDSEAPGR